MKNTILRKILSLTLAFALVVGMIPGGVNVAHADTTITEVSVTDIAVPMVGDTPDYSASVADGAAYYIGTDISGVTYDVNGISWAKRVENSSQEISSIATFEEGVSYDVRMEIYAKDGYTFDVRDNLSIIINGEKGRVISWTATKLFIGYIFPPLEAPKTITSIELSHEYEIEANAYVKNLKVSKINGETFDGEKYAGFQWYRDLANFDDISNATAWNGSKFEGGYAYGLQVKNLPKIDGYTYHSQVAVSIKTPSKSVYSLTDQYGYAYFYWNKLDYKPALESVNIKMDGYYVGENVMNLTFSSEDPIVTTGSYGKESGLYTIRQYNSSTGQYDVLSSTIFAAGKKYYLFYRLQSDLDIYGLEPGNVKINGKAAFSRHVEDGKQYYAFSLDELTEADVVKTLVTSIVVTLPKDKPVAGDNLYYPTVLSVNGDTNLYGVVSTDNVKWYQNDFHIPEEVDYAPADSRFVQGKSYILWMNLTLAEGYKMADTYTLTVQSPSGNLEGVLDSDGESYVSYEYYFNLGAPTKLPVMSSYAMELSGYQAGKEMKETTVELKCNGISVPKEVLKYGQFYVFADQNKTPVTGTFAYDTQYYMGILVGPYNCKIDGLDEAQIKSIVTLHGMHPETVTAVKIGEKIFGWEAYFKLPILKEGVDCNGLSHTFSNKAIKATFSQDGKTYEQCTKGCGTVRNEVKIPKVSSVKLSSTSYTYNGNVQKPSVTVKDSAGKTLKSGTDYDVTYSTGSKNAGTYTCKVVLKGKYSGTKSLSYTINKASMTGIKVSGKEVTYNAKSHTITVSGVPDGAKVYYKTSSGGTYSTTKPTRKSAGTTTVYYKVTKTNYKDVTGSVKIIINKKKISEASLSKTTYVYNGEVKKPTVTVKAGTLTPASKISKSNSNVTIKYADGRKNVGKYKVTITGKGNYTGTITKTFKINPKPTKITSLTKGDNAFTVKWAKKTTQTTGYQIYYTTNSTRKNGKTVTISSNKTTSKKISKLKNKKKYYVWVRTYKTVNGTKYYSTWSDRKYVTTK